MIVIVSLTNMLYIFPISSQGETLRNELLKRFFGKSHPRFRDLLPATQPRHGGPSTAVTLSRADLPLIEVQKKLDQQGASMLIIDLITSSSSTQVFLESIELGIALLKDGNATIQVSMLLCVLRESYKVAR